MKLYKVQIQGILEMPIQAENEAEAEKLALSKLRLESPMKNLKALQTHEFFNCKCSICLMMEGLYKL